MKRFLYIDDNPAHRDLTLELFEGDIQCVANVDEAIKELNNHLYELIICDIMMPGEDGFEFAKSLSKRGIKNKIILTSALPSLRVLEGYTGIENYLGFISKPVTPEKVKRLLRDAA